MQRKPREIEPNQTHEYEDLNRTELSGLHGACRIRRVRELLMNINVQSKEVKTFI